MSPKLPTLKPSDSTHRQVHHKVLEAAAGCAVGSRRRRHRRRRRSLLLLLSRLLLRRLLLLLPCCWLLLLLLPLGPFLLWLSRLGWRHYHRCRRQVQLPRSRLPHERAAVGAKGQHLAAQPVDADVDAQILIAGGVQIVSVDLQSGGGGATIGRRARRTYV